MSAAAMGWGLAMGLRPERSKTALPIRKAAKVTASHTLAAPTVSAMRAPRAPSGFRGPSVVS